MRDLILHNFWWKVFSLLLATLIWYVINFNLETQSTASPLLISTRADNRDFQLPVTVITSAANRRALTIHPTEVRVKVRGDRLTLDRLSRDDIQVYVKLIDDPNPEGSFRLDVRVPPNVVVQQTSPAHVYVTSAGPTNSIGSANSTNN